MKLIDGLYFSNTYPIFLNLQAKNPLFANDDVNLFAAQVYRNGKRTYESTLEYGMKEEIIQYQNNFFFFISSEKYKLLLSIAPFSNIYAPGTKYNITNYSKFIGCPESVEKHHVKRMDKYWIVNNYEAFMNYTRYNNLSVNCAANTVFFNNFMDSLFTTDFRMYNHDKNLGFLKVTDIKNPKYCFNFICYNCILIITQYVRKTRINNNIINKKNGISIISVDESDVFGFFDIPVIDSIYNISPCEICECKGQACGCGGCIIDGGYNRCTNCD